MEMIKKVCNQKIDEIDKKVVDTPRRWDKIAEKVSEVKRK